MIFFQILHLWLRLLAVQLFPPVHLSLLQPLARLPVLRWTLCHLTPHFHVFALHPPTSQLPSCLRRTVPLPLSQCASLPFKRRLRLRCGTPCSYNKTFGSWFPSRNSKENAPSGVILFWSGRFGGKWLPIRHSTSAMHSSPVFRQTNKKFVVFV